MYNGIKPTHLWHLTGRKHFMNMIKQRMESCRRRGRVIEVRDRNDFFMLYGFIMANVVAIAYSFGLFQPPKDCSDMLKKKKQKRIVESSKELCKPNPCPPIRPPKPMPKCPACGRDD